MRPTPATARSRRRAETGRRAGTTCPPLVLHALVGSFVAELYVQLRRVAVERRRGVVNCDDAPRRPVRPRGGGGRRGSGATAGSADGSAPSWRRRCAPRAAR